MIDVVPASASRSGHPGRGNTKQTSAVEATRLIWRVHRAVERPGMALLALVLIVILSKLAGDMMGNANWAFAASVILLIVLNRFFLPISYDGTGEKLVARWPLGSRSISWSDVRRFDAGTDGGILRSRINVSAFDFRAVPLMFPADVNHAKRLRAAIRERIEQGNTPAADTPS